MNRILISFGFVLLMAFVANAGTFDELFKDLPPTNCSKVFGEGSNNQTEVEGKKYWFGVDSVHWKDANKCCSMIYENKTTDRGQNNIKLIAKLENTAEREKLSKYLVTKNYTQDFWLSGNNAMDRKTFKWAPNGEKIGLPCTDWATGCPENPDDFQCVKLSPEKGEYKLKYESCLKKNAFLCADRAK